MPRKFALIIALGLALTLLGSRADAGLIITIDEVGSDVVVNASGSLNIDTLFNRGTFSNGSPGLIPNQGVAYVGPAGNSFITDYSAFFIGPANFGTGSVSVPSFGSGDLVGFNRNFRTLYVPAGYVSGNPLSSSSTYLNRTFASLGLNPGTYAYTYANNRTDPVIDTITVQVGAVAAPEPSTLVGAALGLVGAGLVARRRSRG